MPIHWRVPTAARGKWIKRKEKKLVTNPLIDRKLHVRALLAGGRGALLIRTNGCIKTEILKDA